MEQNLMKSTNRQPRPLTWVWQITRRRRQLRDDFFAEGDHLCRQGFKQIAVNSDQEDSPELERQTEPPVYSCQVSNCKQTFSSLSGSEMHYRTSHSHVCQTCRRSFPTDHLLDVHLLERHDAMFQILAANQNMYQCLLATCKERFPSSKERKNHMINIHRYPANFRFDKPVKCKSVKTTPGNTDGGDASAMEVDIRMSAAGGREPDTSSEESKNQKHISASGRTFVYNVPKSLCFGHGVSRGFCYPKKQGGKKSKQKNWHQMNKQDGMDTTVDIREVQMQDLASALDK